MSTDPRATLRQIMRDMQRTTERTTVGPSDIRDIAESIRALAELMLAQQTSGQDGADLAPTLIRPARQQGGVK